MPVMRWPVADGCGEFGAVQFVECGFVVEEVDLRGRAGLMEIDDALCFGREVRESGEASGVGLIDRRE